MNIAPSEFWRLTPGEWRALIERAPAARGASAMARGDLNALLRLYPDDRS
jgi:uncharacterized phage protein (TIGR02216 family)